MLFGGERSINAPPSILGKRRMICMAFPCKSTKTIRRALRIESPMQEAVIEYVRRVSDHCSYDAWERRGVFAAGL